MKHPFPPFITDEAFWEHFAPDNDGYLPDEYNRPFIEVETAAVEFLNTQDRKKQRALTHVEIIEISDQLGHELSYSQRSGMLQRLKTLLIFMPAIRDVHNKEKSLHYMEIDDIRPFIENDGWPLILPPILPSENVEECSIRLPLAKEYRAAVLARQEKGELLDIEVKADLETDPKAEVEIDERSYELVEVLKKNGWDEEENKQKWAQRHKVFKEDRQNIWGKNGPLAED